VCINVVFKQVEVVMFSSSFYLVLFYLVFCLVPMLAQKTRIVITQRPDCAELAAYGGM